MFSQMQGGVFTSEQRGRACAALWDPFDAQPGIQRDEMRIPKGGNAPCVVGSDIGGE